MVLTQNNTRKYNSQDDNFWQFFQSQLSTMLMLPFPQIKKKSTIIYIYLPIFVMQVSFYCLFWFLIMFDICVNSNSVLLFCWCTSAQNRNISGSLNFKNTSVLWIWFLSTKGVKKNPTVLAVHSCETKQPNATFVMYFLYITWLVY